ncbi:MAG: leucine-rich repeat domain-containing protein, partial [Desulfovibrionaceae bacterium]
QPEQIGAHTELTSLALSICENITTLHEQNSALTALTSLRFLDCENLTVLPEQIGALTALTSLDLLDCENLTVLPEQIGALTALTSLDLQGCENLTVLPEQIGALTALTSLDLQGCKNLTALPEQIGALTALTSLDLQGCENLTSLPAGLGKCHSLCSLDLRSCHALTTAPPSLGDLPDTLAIRASGTPLRDPPLQIVEKGPQAIREWRETRNAALPMPRWSSEGTLTRRQPTWLAWTELAVMHALAIWCIRAGYEAYYWYVVWLAPLLLFKTSFSKFRAVGWYKKAGRTFGLKKQWSYHHSIPSLLCLPVRLLVFGALSILIKIGATFWETIRHPWIAACAMRSNYRYQMLCIDTASPKELIPGVEEAYGNGDYNLVRFSDLRGNILLSDGSYRRERNNTVARIATACLYLFFVIAVAYRLAIKSTAFIYLPFLFVFTVGDNGSETFRQRMFKKCAAQSNKAHLVFVFLVFATLMASLYYLCTLAGNAIAATLTKLYGKASILANMLPLNTAIKIFVSMALFWSALYLVTQGILLFLSAKECSGEHGFADDAPIGAPLCVIQVCYVLCNIISATFIAAAFIAASKVSFGHWLAYLQEARQFFF